MCLLFLNPNTYLEYGEFVSLFHLDVCMQYYDAFFPAQIV